MKVPRAAPPPRRSRHPGRLAVAAVPNPSLVRASRPSILADPPPLRAMRSRPSRSPAAPVRRPLEGAHPSFRQRPVPCGTSRPRSRGPAATAQANRRCRPDRLGVARPLKETGRPSHREGVSRRRRVNPGLGLESSGRSSPTSRPRAQALSGRASASDTSASAQRRLRVSSGWRLWISPLTLAEEKGLKTPPGAAIAIAAGTAESC